MKHSFDIMSTKTARKDNTKYLGKDGTQAWRVSTMIDPNDDKSWHACMIYDEALIPAKGKSYEIELSENDGFKNWDYKLLSKKEQILEQTAPPVTPEMEAESLVKNTVPDFTPPKEEYKPRDYDNENRGKIRHGVSIAYIEKGAKLDDELKMLIEEWVEYIFTGK